MKAGDQQAYQSAVVVSVVAQLNEDWRVVLGGNHFVLEKRSRDGAGHRWRGRCFHRNKDDLFKSIRRFAGECRPEAIAKIEKARDVFGEADSLFKTGKSA